MDAEPISTEVAHEQGYSALTNAFTPDESDMLERAIENRRNVPHVLVKVPGGVEVWRLESQMVKA